jgi:endo-1,4-beta-xylanase
MRQINPRNGQGTALTALFFAFILSLPLSTSAASLAANEELPSLYETYQEDFLFGSAAGRQELQGRRFEEVKRHFNVMTLENSMKPSALGGNKKGAYTFSTTDNLVATLEEAGIPIHGHTLAWHSQSARWLNMDDSGAYLTREEARANLEDYITTVATHYAGRVISWDVVNEAFRTSVNDYNFTDWRTVLRTGTLSGNEAAPWYGAYENGADTEAGESGADYIYDAFVFARLADPNATLYYNDFNETEKGKREAIAMMTEELNEKWRGDPRNTEPNRLLIEGLGMQAHYWMKAFDLKAVEDTILRWQETGVEISISELDIPSGDWRGFDPFNERLENAQARQYAQLFQLFKEHSNVIARVTVWGLDDPNSWRSAGSPLLFRAAGVPKMAYYGVLDPDGYLAGDYDTAEETPAPTPVPTPEPPPDEEPSPPPVEEESNVIPSSEFAMDLLVPVLTIVIALGLAWAFLMKKKKPKKKK